MTFANDILKFDGGLIDRASDYINTRLAERAERARKDRVYRDTLHELKSLSARDLADIGLAPASLEDIAREAAFGKQQDKDTDARFSSLGSLCLAAASTSSLMPPPL